jgi:hypothetical protein
MAKRTPGNQKQAQVQLDIRPDTPSFYVNYITVSHTAYDFTLSATKIPSPFTPEQVEVAKNGKPILLEAMLQVVLPPLLVEGLIKALIDQKEKYEKTMSQQVRNNEIQHQHIKLPSSI